MGIRDEGLAEVLRELEVGPGLRGHRHPHVEIHRRSRKLSAQRCGHGFGDGDACLVLRLPRRRPEMGRHHDVVEVEQRALGRRFAGEHVHRGPCHVPRLAGGGERGLVDDAAARDVDEPDAALHGGDGRSVDHSFGLPRARKMHGDEVGLLERSAEASHLDTDPGSPLRGHIGVVGDDLHPERRGALGDEGSDAPEPEDGQGLSVQLHPLERTPLPLAGAERTVRHRHLPGLRQQERHRVLGGGYRVRRRCVDDEDTPLGRLVQVDVVDADPGASDDAETGSCLEERFIDARCGTDDEGRGVGNSLNEFLGREADGDVHLELCGEQLDAGRCDLLGDDDLVGHGAMMARPGIAESVLTGATAGRRAARPPRRRHRRGAPL